MSMDRQNEVAKIEVIEETEIELGDVVGKKIGDKHLWNILRVTLTLAMITSK